ncbi:hypothetical protein SAMN04488563_0138 [Jiangella alkaliphila]|uniref:Uncharacterized protein n=1 Tax=Jiangella alkaliphila TaxID=419479 RepID=A0A1H2FV76_9ACTN|nr:hypothetical protein SAMN04488563_0138 [Jiangella alkaliphila]
MGETEITPCLGVGRTVVELLSFRRGWAVRVCKHSKVPSVHASLAVAALAGVLALASASGSTLLAGGLALVIVIFTLGGVAAARAGAARWSAGIALMAGLGALGWTWSEGSSDLTPMAALLGPTLVASIVVQLLRRDGRAGLTTSLALSVTACVLAVLPVALLALRESHDGEYPVGLALLGVGAVGLAESLPMSRAVGRLVGVLLAALGAGALVLTTDWVSEAVPAVSAVVVATFAGLLAAVAFAAVDRLADEFTPQPAPVAVRVGGDPAAGPGAEAGPGAGAEPAPLPRGASAFLPLRVSLPFVAAAPVAYVLGRIFVS